MKKITLAVFICAILLSVIISCSIKKRVYMNGYHIEWFSRNNTKPQIREKQFLGYSINAYDALSVKPGCERVIDASLSTQLTCDEGTVIEIPENAFMYEKGGEIKCSKVNVLVSEFYAMSDIVEAGLTTTCNSTMLASGGMVYIAANCTGERLKLKPGKKIIVRMPARQIEKGMRIFSGKLEKGIIDWTPGPKAKEGDAVSTVNLEGDNELMLSDQTDGIYKGDPENYEEGTYFQDAYVMESTKLGWINCDRFPDIKEPVDIFVNADTSNSNSVALIFRNMKSVLPGYKYSNKFTEFHRLPKGEDVTVIAYRINKKTKQTFVGREDLKLGDQDSIQLQMEEVDLAQFKTMLKEFN
ncbi:MAG: hypothetical protein IAF38_16270 [Bacteroidia bacterium]|nr:hypothetical protein [Bacteroidia bacterium]